MNFIYHKILWILDKKYSGKVDCSNLIMKIICDFYTYIQLQYNLLIGTNEITDGKELNKYTQLKF